MGRGTPNVNKPLGEPEGSIRNEAEERAVGVMPDFREPPRGNVRGEGSKKCRERDLEQMLLCNREGGRFGRDNKPE